MSGNKLSNAIFYIWHIVCKRAGTLIEFDETIINDNDKINCTPDGWCGGNFSAIKYNNQLIWRNSVGPNYDDKTKEIYFKTNYELLGPWPTLSDIDYFSRCFEKFNKSPTFWMVDPYNEIDHYDKRYSKK